MKIAIVNDIHVGPPLQFKELMRASSHLVEQKLQDLLHYIQNTHQPDLVVNLGDLIRSQNRESDVSLYQKLIPFFRTLQTPSLHLVGNHELKCNSVETIESLWENHGYLQKSYGSLEINGHLIVWLGLEIRDTHYKRRVVPDEQVVWLQEKLQQTQKPVYLFTHTPFDDHDVTGNFFYETFDARNTQGFFLENGNHLREIVATCPYVKAVFQAHLHYFHCKMIGSVPFITCPALGDNICGPNAQDNVPEIYTIVQANNSRLNIKAYSREFCFAGLEF